ncbi:3-deoxy-manno-octulosonate cytidylyltransferase [Sulfuriroseicoccus oceanibius]|uniref:3-deoxy-manno-octulosonate cytidylyltransferase n=1 Tax=Sulfuriroseicoccus oceanibius TaxID=2707525 RepID=A0A6B3LCB3_9BACT|nr:3-deoxy-manno-octulosonate cytidylyltransferase [Sulfuriroseicoccus oceanibius]QQL44710.1 3-deoxy-manno-octulosonate cytidylyltransferase [Sulfuriroseicoccus oceanibius]
MTASPSAAPSQAPGTIAAVIPARWASSRFPGKPLHPIAGKPMIQRVWERCRQCQSIDRVIIATDDQRIADAATAFGADVTMTRADHASGTDRIAEVMEKNPDVDAVVNVQGDEPMIDPALVDELASLLRTDPSLQMATAANVIDTTTEAGMKRFLDPNVVKVVRNATGDALYFSRSPIPHNRDGAVIPAASPLHHKGIYAYTRKLLLDFITWPPSPLEQSEALEQLRALDHGITIRVITTDDESPGVDTPEQVATIEALIAADPSLS